MASTHDGRVTQRVGVDDLVRLASDPPRAAIAFATESGPGCVPVLVRRIDDQIQVGLDPASLPSTRPLQRAVLLVDDGRYWFDLQAIVRRGVLGPLAEGSTRALVWVPFASQHEVAWDYGSLRAEPAG